jgi:FtsP/CotA-like multicopper oxidase with cupredoxin domain
MNTALKIFLGIVVVAMVGLIFTTQDIAAKPYSSADVSGLPNAQVTQVVELKNGDTYDLTASYVQKTIRGTTYRMLAYNGSIPGPLIKIAQGSEVTISFKNDTDMKTLLHSHGVRMDHAFDGSQTSQVEMKPGEVFSYKLKFPDAGVFWYHPHVREDFQQELGLYGNYLVEPGTANYWSPVNREVPLFVDDILIAENRIPLSKDGADRTLMGRYGNVTLLNGETEYRLSVQRGEVVRWYITNAANTRPFRIGIKGARVKLVGADGGAYERESWVDTVTLGPSERAVIEVLFDTPGTYAIQNITPEKTETLGEVVVSDTPVITSYATDFEVLRTHTETVQSIDPFRQYITSTPDKEITLSIDMRGNMMNMPNMGHGQHMMPGGAMMGGSMMATNPDGIEWEDANQMMNQMSDTNSIAWKIVDTQTKKENMDIDWSFTRGQPVKIRIFNDPKSMHPMQHPIHFHGQRFLIVARDGIPESNLVWKDTVLVPSGKTVDIVLDTSNPGEWMAHCHIAEHLEAGMMFTFKVQ